MPSNFSDDSYLTLVIDQGSHASRIGLFSESGELIYLKSQSISTISTKDTHEQNAGDILQSIFSLLNDLPHHLSKQIKSCGLCTQRSTIVAWHKTSGVPLSPAISWRDTRAQPLIDELAAEAHNIQEISGLPLSAHYSAGKIHWLLNNNAEVKNAEKARHLCISPLASFLLFHLLREKPVIIDHSNAQRCQLFDIDHLEWSAQLLSLFQINPHILPSCAPVIHNFGHLHLNNIPVTCVAGDQNTVLYAYPDSDQDDDSNTGSEQNRTLINIGTGAFILSSAEAKNTAQGGKKNPMLHTLSSSDQQHSHFVTEGTVNGAGDALSWAQKNDACNDLFSLLPNWLQQVKSPPVFINSITRLGSPWWCDAGNPEFIGDTKHLQSDRYVAIIESIVFLIFKNIQQLQPRPDTLFISGGLSRLDGLYQKLADLSQTRVQRFNNTEASARGCAWLANQIFKKNNPHWKPLVMTQQFIPANFQTENSSRKHAPIDERYQQFVGELNKRCSYD